MTAFAAESPLFWLLASLAVLLAGFSKAATGGGIAILAVPLMSLVIAPARAAAIMLPILCVMDLLGLWSYRGRADKRLLAMMIPGALIGIAAGALVFGVVDVRWVKAVLGLECLLFAINRLRSARQLAVAEAKVATRGTATFWSSISGFTSTLAHAGGPPMMQFLLPLKLEKLTFVATTVTFFSIVNYLKLVPYGFLGLLDLGNLGTSLMLAPVIPIGYWIGLRFAKAIPEKPFFTFVTWSLLVTGLKLLWDGVVGP